MGDRFMKVATSSTQGVNSAPPKSADEIKKKSIESSKKDSAKIPPKIGGSSPEKVEISSRARDIEKAEKIAKAPSENNEAKIEALKKAVQSGQYKIDEDAIADRLITEHMQTASVM